MRRLRLDPVGDPVHLAMDPYKYLAMDPEHLAMDLEHLAMDHVRWTLTSVDHVHVRMSTVSHCEEWEIGCISLSAYPQSTGHVKQEMGKKTNFSPPFHLKPP